MIDSAGFDPFGYFYAPAEEETRYKCPHCNQEVSKLRYKSYVTEWGDADLNGDIIDTDSTDYDETYFYCPHCGEEFAIEALLVIEKEVIEKEVKEEDINILSLKDKRQHREKPF